MVRVTINGQQYEVKTTWEEVEADKLIACQTFKDEVKALTTLPPELVDKATDLQLFPLYTAFSFIDDMESVAPLQALSVEDAPYDQIEQAKVYLGEEGKPYKKVLRCAQVYYDQEKNPVQLIRLGVNIVHQITVFLKNYQEMSKGEPRLNEQIAGIDKLTAFGSWGTVFNLAGRDLTKVRKIYAMPAIEVYTTLFYAFREAKYQKELFKLDHPKK